MWSPRRMTISAEGQQMPLDGAATPTNFNADVHHIGAHREDSSCQAHGLPQLSQDAFQSSVSIPVSNATFAEALSTPLFDFQQQIRRPSSSGRYSAVSQNKRSETSDAFANDTTNHSLWEGSRPPHTALEPEDWEFEPETSFAQVYIPTLHFEELSERRFGVIASRVNARELRKQLRGQREAVTNEIGQILQKVRTLILEGGKQEVDSLLSQYEDLQELNERLQAEDDEYDLLEKGLIDQEWSLKLAEDAFYHRFSSWSSHASPSVGGESPAAGDVQFPNSRFVPRSSPDDNGVLARQRPQDFEVELVRAKLRHLESEYMELREEEHLRETLGRTLDKDSSFALRVFSVRKAELLHYLSFHEERATEAKHTVDNSIDQFPTYQYTGHDLEVLARQGALNGVPGSPDIIAHDVFSDEAANLPRDPLLLTSANEDPFNADIWGHSTYPQDPSTQDPSTRDPSTRDPSTRDPLTRDPSTRDPSTRDPSTQDHLAYINDWLLHMLRCSRFALMQLKNKFGDTAKSLDAQTLKSLVLSLWNKDEMSAWYEESVERAARSHDPSSLSASVFMQLQATLSDPTLLLRHERLEPVEQSRSVFARRSEVEDLVSGLNTLAMDKRFLHV